MGGEVKEMWVGSEIIWKEAASTVLPSTDLNKHPPKVLCCTLEHLPGAAGRAPPAAQQLDNQGSIREHSTVVQSRDLQSSNTSTEIH